MKDKVYITTPLYYVNAAPHIGHSYTNVAADCLARYYRLRGDAVFLLTGTDEHGQKIEQSAKAAGKSPQAFVDSVVVGFVDLWKRLGIHYDDFIRTTEPRHVTIVQEVLQKLHDDGKLKRASYTGWYCTPCETFYTQEELTRLGVPAEGSPACPSCGRPMDAVEEEGWYLGLRESQEWLKAFVKKRKGWIVPESRYNELLGLLEDPLPEFLCITRPRDRVGWGIPVPFDPDHVIYVWFDALLNYISAAGYLRDDANFSRLWPADFHFIGKDILRHHALYWPIMLHALGFPDDAMPRCIFAHGWWKVGEQKMSKSLGNVVDPYVVIDKVLEGQPFAADIYRYFLLREVPFGQDGSFSVEALLGRLESDLANDLGNLVSRALSMIDRYCGGEVPVSGAPERSEDKALWDRAQALPAQLDAAFPAGRFSLGIEAIMALVSDANRYIEAQVPWKLAKDPNQAPRLQAVLHMLAEVLRVTAVALDPVIPSVAASIWEQLGLAARPRAFSEVGAWPGFEEGHAIEKAGILFPKGSK